MKSCARRVSGLRKSICFISACLMLCITATVAAETRLQLDESRITGMRELPKVLYIVPWKKTAPSLDLLPMRSLLEEPVEPIEIGVFRRQLRYYDMLHEAAPHSTPAR